MKDPYLRLQELSSELWNERKALDYSRPNQKKRIFKRLDQIIKDIKQLDFESENKSLQEIHQDP